MTEEQETLKAVGETMAEKPKTFDIDVKPKGKLHKLAIWLKISPSRLHYDIKPQRVDNIYRIASRAVTFDIGSLFTSDDQAEVLSAMMKVMARHGEDIFYVVACILQNDHREPTKKTMYAVKNYFEMDDVLNVLVVGVSTYNISAFINSIAFIIGVDALKVTASPMKTGV